MGRRNQQTEQEHNRQKRAWRWKLRQCHYCPAYAKTSCNGWIGDDRGHECGRPVCLRHAVPINTAIDLCRGCAELAGVRRRQAPQWKPEQSGLFDRVEEEKGGEVIETKPIAA